MGSGASAGFLALAGQPLDLRRLILHLKQYSGGPLTWTSVGGSMLRLSRLTDYGVVVLVQLGSGEAVQTAPGIARATGIPEPTVAKVLKILASSTLVISQRGARGGYRLSRALHQTTIAEVIAAIDGPITVTACVESSLDNCDARAQCPMHGRWDRVNDAIRQALLGITVADLAQPAWAHLPPRGAVGLHVPAAE